MYCNAQLAAYSELSNDAVMPMIRTDRNALLQAWYQSLYGVAARNEAEVEQVMETTEKAQADAIRTVASDNSQAIDLYA